MCRSASESPQALLGNGECWISSGALFKLVSWLIHARRSCCNIVASVTVWAGILIFWVWFLICWFYMHRVRFWFRPRCAPNCHTENTQSRPFRIPKVNTNSVNKCDPRICIKACTSLPETRVCYKITPRKNINWSEITPRKKYRIRTRSRHFKSLKRHPFRRGICLAIIF